MAEKIRAERNRTLTVSECEISSLENYILGVNDLKRSFADNTIVNADLFDCLDNIPNDYFNLIIINSSLKFEIKAKQFYAASQRVL